MKSKYSRREIVKHSTYILGGATLLGLSACTGKKEPKPGQEPPAADPGQTEGNPTADENAATSVNPPGESPLISMEHQTAKSLKYATNATSVDPKLRVEKNGVAGEEQFCDNCKYYKPVKGQTYGACQLIPVPGKHVAQKGWCITWVKNS